MKRRSLVKLDSMLSPRVVVLAEATMRNVFAGPKPGGLLFAFLS